MRPPNRVLSGYGTTIFEVMSGLAREHDAINLGQGFPDGNGPDDVRAVAARALEDGPNQYPPMMGVPELRDAVAAHGRRFYDLDVTADNVMITSGATEALAVSLLGLLDPGDEAIVFEPAYDSYVPVIRLAGAKAVPVRLSAPDWAVPWDALEAAFSDRTKLVVLNSPLNPAGKVFSRAELERLAALIERYDSYAVCDEVYEHLTFTGARHIPLMTLPGMFDRCIRIGSAGKTFSLTGWKVGYLTAAKSTLSPVAKAHQFLNFTTPPNLQRAVAYGLTLPDTYFEDLAASMEKRRDLLSGGLAELGFDIATCDGTYFLNAGFAGLGFAGTDVEFCRHLTTEAKVAAIPVSAFYGDGADSQVARFCFCKDESTVHAALERLRAFFAQ